MKIEKILFIAIIITTLLLVYCLLSVFDNPITGCSCCAGGVSKACCHYDSPDCLSKEEFFKKYNPGNYEECRNHAIEEYWYKDCMLVDGKYSGAHIGCCGVGWNHAEEICEELK